MEFRALYLLIMFLITNSVCSKQDSNLEVGTEKNIKTRYNFNHPPSSEYYKPIPVAVVYEDAGGYNGKSETTTTAIKFDNDAEVNLTEENIQTTTEQPETTTAFVKVVDAKSKIALIPKPRALKNLQVPVSVFYESDTSNQNYHRTKSETITKSLKRGLNRRRNQQNKTSVNITNVETPKEIVFTEMPTVIPVDPQPSIKVKTFKKRTGGRDPVVPIIESESYVFSHSGNFHYRYEGGDGTKAYSEGKLKTVDEQTGEAVVGGFSYTDKEGNDFSLSYTADENGYRPVGAHLPTPPPIPPAIARALAYLATATPEPVTKRPSKSQINKDEN